MCVGKTVNDADGTDIRAGPSAGQRRREGPRAAGPCQASCIGILVMTADDASSRSLLRDASVLADSLSHGQALAGANGPMG